MWKKPTTVLLALLIFFIACSIVDLPEQYPLNISIGSWKQQIIINPPSWDFSLLGFRFQKQWKTHLGLDLSGGTQVVLEADMSELAQGDRASALESAKQVIERRVNFFGVSEPVVQTSRTNEAYRIIVELPGVTNGEEAIQTIGQTAQLEFREFTSELAATSAGSIIPTLDTTTSVGITGKDLKRASVTFSQQTGEPEVAIEFTPEGTKKFAEATKRLVGKELAIFLDDSPVMWPRVNQEIANGSGVISGGFTQDAAKILALQLNAGALPVPVSVVEKRTIGATLGKESIEKSMYAGAVGLGIIAIFMIAQYGRLGLLADIGLLYYGVLSLALFRFIPVTMTLPGIAGFILSIGMAVDSNILIFERFKEEKRSGKPWKMAMELAFGRAWDSIRDANITTIITALILYNPLNWQMFPSSGLVRGFAITLLFGVLISLFTGIVVTRTLVRALYRET